MAAIQSVWLKGDRESERERERGRDALPHDLDGGQQILLGGYVHAQHVVCATFSIKTKIKPCLQAECVGRAPLSPSHNFN